MNVDELRAPIETMTLWSLWAQIGEPASSKVSHKSSSALSALVWRQTDGPAWRMVSANLRQYFEVHGRDRWVPYVG